MKLMLEKLNKIYTNFCIAIYFGFRSILLKFDFIEM